MSAYDRAWFEYFRADQAADQAIDTYWDSHREDPSSIATARAYDAAIIAVRRKFAAERLAEGVTAGTSNAEMARAVAVLNSRFEDAKREAELEVRRHARGVRS